MIKKVIKSENAPAAIGPYSQGIDMGNTVYVSGQIPVNAIALNIPETIEEQTKQSLENVKAVLNEAEYTIENVVKCTVFLSDMNNFSKMNEVYGEYFSNEPPARACVEVSRLPKDVLVEIEAIAVK